MNFLCILLFLIHTEAKHVKNKQKYVADDMNSNMDISSVSETRAEQFDITRSGLGDVRLQEPSETYDLKMPTEQELMLNNDRPMELAKKGIPAWKSPRDEMLYYRKNSKTPRTQSNDPKLYDFARGLENNLAIKSLPRNRYNKKSNESITASSKGSKSSDVTNYFDDSSFYLKSTRKKVNWTTCDEFAKNALFHPDDIVNTPWLPFYIWSRRHFAKAIVHKFIYPNKQVVQHYQSVYGPYIRKLNWKQPKLLLRESREMLLIAGDRKGLFFAIPEQQLSESMKSMNITLPVITLRMKIYNPYLALMYCDDNYATIMAELGTEPTSNLEKTQEASTLKFIGLGNPATRNIIEERRALEKKLSVENKPKKFLDVRKGFVS